MRQGFQSNILYIEDTTKRITDYLMKIMKKLTDRTVSVRVITYILLAALLISLVLLLRLGLYTNPWGDDYEYAKYTKSFQEAYGRGLYNALRGAHYQAVQSWYCWQGTFSSIFLMAFAPLGFGEQYYFIGSFILIISLTCGSIVLNLTVTRRIFGFDKDASLCFSLAMTILMVWRIYNPNEGFYWYNGGLHYVGMHSVMMLFVAVSICIMSSCKPITIVLSVIAATFLAVVCSGANYVTALQGILILLLLVIIGVAKYKKKALLYVPVLVMYIVGLRMSITAQGNVARASYFVGESMSPIRAILTSFPEAAKHLWEFTGVFTIVFMIAMVPVIWKGVESATCKFRFPGIFIVLGFCFYATSYTASLYGMGRADLDRMLNVAQLTFQFVLILSEVYFIGWLKGRLSIAKSNIGYLWLYVASVAVLAVSFVASKEERFRYTPYGAYYYVHTGEAAAYHDGYLRRIESIKEQGPDARVVPNIFKPAYICTGELSEDPATEVNTFMAHWYGKNSLAIVDEKVD